MQREPETKEVVGISDMARAVGLSRARFYELMREGVFPAPDRDEKTKRPYYGKDQQEQCLRIRRTNCGANGRPVLFYAQRAARILLPKSRPQRRPGRRSETRLTPSRDQRGDGVIGELVDGLKQLGMEAITDVQVKNALADLYPDGWSGRDRAELLGSVFRGLSRRDTRDNVT